MSDNPFLDDGHDEDNEKPNATVSTTRPSVEPVQVEERSPLNELKHQPQDVFKPRTSEVPGTSAQEEMDDLDARNANQGENVTKLDEPEANGTGQEAVQDAAKASSNGDKGAVSTDGKTSSEYQVATDGGSPGGTPPPDAPSDEEQTDPHVDPEVEKIESRELKEREERSKQKLRAQREHQLLEFSPIDRDYLTRTTNVFEPPPDYQAFLADLKTDPRRERNIFIISGDDNTGRYAIASQLALHLTKNQTPPPIYEYIADATTSTLSLQEIIKKLVPANAAKNTNSGTESGALSAVLPKGSILIIPDVFEDNGIKVKELSLSFARRFQRILNDCNIRLILTTVYRPDEHTEFQNYLYFSTVDQNGELKVDPKQVYQRHLDYYFDKEASYTTTIRELLDKAKEPVLGKLKRPVNIYNFFDRIASNEPQDIDAAVKIAEQIVGRYDRRAETRKWFEDVEDFNTKLYVMFVVLFKGLKQNQLDEVYDAMINYLRGTMSDRFKDPRYMSVEQTLEALHLQERREVLEFIGQQSRDYEKEIQYQIKNYHRLLWSLVEPLQQIIIESRPGDSNDRRVRRLLATVIAQIGIFRPARLADQLRQLAMHPQGHVVLSTADVLRYLAQDVKYHAFVLDILKDWTESKQYELMWAAIVAIPSVYEVSLYTLNAKQQGPQTVAEELLNDKDALMQTLQTLRDLLDTLCNYINSIDLTTLHEYFEAQTQANKERRFKQFPDLYQDYLSNPKRRRKIDEGWERSKQNQIFVAWRAMADDLMIALVRSVENIAQSSTSDAVDILKKWLDQESNSIQWVVGRMAANNLFLSTTRSQLAVIDDSLPILQLLLQMLRASRDTSSDMYELLVTMAFGDDMEQANLGQKRGEILELIENTPIDTVMSTLNTWYGYLVDAENVDADGNENSDDSSERNLWHAQIYPALLKTINEATQADRQLLTDSLITYWLDSTHSEVRRSALALLTRSYVLDGVVLDVPVSRYGVIMIDAGDVRAEGYLEAVFHISQRLTTLTPLRVYHMGLTGTPPLLLGQFRSDDLEAGTITSKTLQAMGAPRPMLIMPIFDPLIDAENPPDETALINPQDCHFVLILNTTNVVDWDDVLDDAQQVYAPNNENNPNRNIFAEDDTPEEEAPTAEWAWKGKFLIVGWQTMRRPAWLSEEIVFIYDAPNNTLQPDILRVFENKLQQQIILALHRQPDDVWLHDLIQYISYHEQHVEEELDLLGTRMDNWMLELDRVIETIPPRDVTLIIAWTILLLSRHELNAAVDKVTSWLESDDPKAKLMGRACTKQLFNYYGVEGFTATVADHAPLLRLLVPFMKANAHYTELDRIIFIVLEWAKDASWSERLLLHPEGAIPELLAVIAEITDKEAVDWLAGKVNFYEALLRIKSLFIHLSSKGTTPLCLNEFIELTNKLIEWVNNEIERQTQLQQLANPTQATPQARRKRGVRRRTQAAVSAEPLPLPSGISLDSAHELLELPGLNRQNQDAILKELRLDEQRLSKDKHYRSSFVEVQHNVKAVLDSMRLQLFSKEGTRPPLPKGHCYGLILVDATVPDESMSAEIANTSIEFLKALHVDKDGKNIVPIIHRLGRREIIYTYGDKPPKKIQLKPTEVLPRNLPCFAPLIGPILSTYPFEEVAFVFIITTKSIPDSRDWTELNSPDWRQSIFVYPLNARVFVPDVQTLQISDIQSNEPKHIMPDVVRYILRRVANCSAKR